jgi:O-antigen/teichoic acid export membrane protein
MLQHLRPLIKDSAIYALGGISNKVVGFILLPFYVDKLTATEYGILGTLEVTSQLIITLVGLNLSVAFLRWYNDKELEGRRKSTFFTVFSVIAAIALLFNICCFPFAHSLSRLLFAGDYARLVRLMVFSAGIDLTGTIPVTLCRLQSKSMQYVRNLTIRLGIVLVLTILFLAVFDRKVEGIYEAQIIGGLAYLSLFVPYILKNIRIRFEKIILGKMFHYSLPLILSSIFGTILGIADRFSLNFISGLASVGIYSLGFKLANSLKMIAVQPLNMALPPLMFRMVDKPGAKNFYAKLMTYITFGLMFFVMAISLFGQETVKFIASEEPEYWGAYTIIPFIALSILFGMLKDQLIYCLQITKKTMTIAFTVIIVSILNIALNILLIPFFNVTGAALSILLTQFVYFLLVLRYAQHYYPVPYEYKKIFLSIGTGILYCAAAYLIRDWGLGWRLCVKTVLLGSYPFVLYLFRFYDRNELQALKGFRKKWRRPGDWKDHIRTLKF